MNLNTKYAIDIFFTDPKEREMAKSLFKEFCNAWNSIYH